MDQAVELTQEARWAPLLRRPARSVSGRPSWSASELPKKAPAKKAKAPPRRLLAKKVARQEGSGQEGGGQEGHPEVVGLRAAPFGRLGHGIRTIDSELPPGNSESTFWTVPHTLKA